MIAHDVGEQLEEREYQHEGQESRHDHAEIGEEVAQHVVVEDGGEVDARDPPARGRPLEGRAAGAGQPGEHYASGVLGAERVSYGKPMGNFQWPSLCSP